MIHITCEGRSFDFFDGATPQNLWNMVRGTRGKEAAVLAEMDGELLDFQTPFPSGGDVRWIPLSAPKAHQAYVRSAIMLLVCAVEARRRKETCDGLPSHQRAGRGCRAGR